MKCVFQLNCCTVISGWKGNFHNCWLLTHSYLKRKFFALRTHQISGLLTPSNIVKAEKVRRIFKEQQSGCLRKLCQFLVKYGNNKLLIICSCQVFLLPLALISSSRALFPWTAKYVKKSFDTRDVMSYDLRKIILNSMKCPAIAFSDLG